MCTQNEGHLAIKDEAVSIASPPIDHGAGSERSDKAGCIEWALENSLFYADLNRIDPFSFE